MSQLVQRDEAGTRYEIVVDGTVAGFAEIRDLDGATAFTHTVVADGYEGQGIGTELVRAALEDVRARGGSVVPLCSFVAAWIDRHDHVADLVDTEALARHRG